MNIKIINKSNNPLPTPATAGAAAADLYAHLDRAVNIAPFSTRLIPTGLFMAIPQGYVGHVTPRSGLALKEGLTVHNAPGKIDSDYRGEVGVILYNGSPIVRTVEPGQRIAQFSIQKAEPFKWELTSILDETERGAGGFGSTGKK